MQGAGLGWSHMCPSPGAVQPRCEGRRWGWLGWGLMGQQGEAGSPGTTIYKPAFSFGRLPSSSPPQHQPEKGPIVLAPDGPGPGTRPHNGADYAPGRWGSGSRMPRRSSCRRHPCSSPAAWAVPRHGLLGREGGRRGSRPHSFVTSANTMALVPWVPGGTGGRNAPALHSMLPSFPGSLWCR